MLFYSLVFTIQQQNGTKHSRGFIYLICTFRLFLLMYFDLRTWKGYQVTKSKRTFSSRCEEICRSH